MRIYLRASQRLFGTMSPVGRCLLIKSHASDTYDQQFLFFIGLIFMVSLAYPEYLKGRKSKKARKEKKQRNSKDQEKSK